MIALILLNIHGVSAMDDQKINVIVIEGHNLINATDIFSGNQYDVHTIQQPMKTTDCLGESMRQEELKTTIKSITENDPHARFVFYAVEDGVAATLHFLANNSYSNIVALVLQNSTFSEYYYSFNNITNLKCYKNIPIYLIDDHTNENNVDLSSSLFFLHLYNNKYTSIDQISLEKCNKNLTNTMPNEEFIETTVELSFQALFNEYLTKINLPPIYTKKNLLDNTTQNNILIKPKNVKPTDEVHQNILQEFIGKENKRYYLSLVRGSISFLVVGLGLFLILYKYGNK